MSVPHEVPKRTSEVPTRCPKPVSTPREQYVARSERAVVEEHRDDQY